MKQILRQKIIAARASLDLQCQEEASAIILRHLIELLQNFQFLGISGDKNVIGLYWPISGEPNLLKLCDLVSSDYALPKLRREAGMRKMDFVRYRPGDVMNTSIFADILEPESDEVMLPNILVIPALAYDENGVRLGFGGGYYDQYINARHQCLLQAPDHQEWKMPIKIGICFERFLHKSIDAEAHDLIADFLITENGCTMVHHHL
jgi:5-formyltetrahydrofolate cyclo-ligase